MKIKIIIFLFIILIIILNFNNLQSKDDIFIYKSPKIDYEEFYIENKNFLSFNGVIYSVQKNYLILTNRYYIPIKKIKLEKGEYLITNDDEFLYLFNKENGKIYKYSKNKISFITKYKSLDANDFKIYKDNIYFLNKNEIIVLNKDFKENKIGLNDIFNKFKIIDGKFYLINNEKLTICNLNGIVEKELKDNFKKLISFDINIDKKIYLLDLDEIKVYDLDLKLEKFIKLDEVGDEIFFDTSRALMIYFKNSGLKVLPPQINYKVLENLNHPSDITIDEEKNIYVLSSGGSKVLVYDKHLNFKYSFGENILNHPQGIYYYNGKIYVSDSWNNKVRIFDKNGDLILSFGNFGEKENEFSYPSRIKVIDNKIYVLDVYNHKLKIFDLNGKFLNSYGSEPYLLLKRIIKPKDTIINPMEFFIKNNKVYIIDEYTLIEFDNKIKKYGLNDYITKVFSFNDNIYFIGLRMKYIYKFNEKENKIIPVFSIVNNYNKKQDFIIPYSFIVEENKIYILDRTNSKLYLIEGTL